MDIPARRAQPSAVRRRIHQIVIASVVALAGLAAPAAALTATAPATSPAPPAGTSSAAKLIADDGLPTGQETAEGVACDLARAFASADADTWKGITLKLPADDQAHGALDSYVGKVSAEMEAEAAKPAEERSGPKEVATCYQARHLSAASVKTYATSLYQYQDVMFVDVVVKQHDGADRANRTLVVKDKDGKWYVHPLPSATPMLSMGLNDESDSEEEVKKQPPTP